MTEETADLISQMEKQRFLPISEDTPRLYQVFARHIDQNNPDELSLLLFFQGEYFFRIGDFTRALKHLSRCIQAPKSASLKHIEALSYNVMGSIYALLGQESIAVSHLLQAKSMSVELALSSEAAISCANLGLFYQQLKIFDTALTYYEQALSLTAELKGGPNNFRLFCEACRGIVCCKLGRFEEAAQIVCGMEVPEQNGQPSCGAAVLDLKIRVFRHSGASELVKKSLALLLLTATDSITFMACSYFYFDVCSFFLEQRMQSECLAILDHTEECIRDLPLVFPRYFYLKCRVLHNQYFSAEAEYLTSCSDFISLHPAYIQEQQCAKRYSLAYIERLRQTKNASEMYREKSRIDQMTGLLNKHTIQFLVEEDLTKISGTRQSAVILIDLDHFKQINDTIGHLTGDSLICQTASIIQNYFKGSALCGRVGGDEFLVYISDVTDPSSLILQSEILRQEIFRQTSERNITITTQASIGVAFSSTELCDYESLFSAADGALYQTKLKGRNKVVVAE
ncbi:MAG: GGDEF domain-containing protein [Roseburia sp.]